MRGWGWSDWDVQQTLTLVRDDALTHAGLIASIELACSPRILLQPA